MKRHKDHTGTNNTQQDELLEAMHSTCKKIAPLWPLENFVAVNPFMGFTEKHFAEAAGELSAISDIQLTMPVTYYLEKINEGKISKEDLDAVLKDHGFEMDPENFIENLGKHQDSSAHRSTLSLADVAFEETGTDWKRFMVTRLSSWASSYFDKGQAHWKASIEKGGIFSSWRAEAIIDPSPELSGLSSFREYVRELPVDHQSAAAKALDILNLSHNEAKSVYFHRLLRVMGGWSAYMAYLDWEANLNGNEQGNLVELLSILMCYEACLMQSLNHPEVNNEWEANCRNLTNYTQTGFQQQHLAENLMLQDALDRAAQREILAKFKPQLKKEVQEQTPKAQAVFCIDVRSEVFRRNLENSDSQIQTIGFAGFFGFAVNVIPLGSEKSEPQAPVLIKPGLTVREEMPNEDSNDAAISGRLIKRQLTQVWRSFKAGAITCFGFVSPVGLSYLPKLVTDSFGWSRPVADPQRYGLSKETISRKTIGVKEESLIGREMGIPFTQQVETAKNALTGMSLTDSFAKYIFFMGHGSTTVNNPHATGLDCGACGGHTGEANAKVAATILNDLKVREALAGQGIEIPSDTMFIAGLHDTTTDEVTLFNIEGLSEEQLAELDDIKGAFAKAGHLSRLERSLKMDIAEMKDIDTLIKRRSTDWSQVRPEWGLAGCSSFIVADRSHTTGIDLNGKSFLHSYNWKKDQDFAVLEQIMTAPMIVTSWINLQYYASSVDNKNLGAGNKTLHNVTAGLGVIEGSSGDLRTGLPLQSVHDGQQLQHEPLRLSVIIEAPTEAINKILEKHDAVRDLCDNEWINLITLNDDGVPSSRYKGNLVWEDITISKGKAEIQEKVLVTAA